MFGWASQPNRQFPPPPSAITIILDFVPPQSIFCPAKRPLDLTGSVKIPADYGRRERLHGEDHLTVSSPSHLPLAFVPG